MTAAGRVAAADDILHVTTPDAWDAARQAGAVTPSSLETEGFVHCSTRAQLATTLARHFRGAGPLVLLVLDPAAVEADLRWEESRSAELFPHVYAALPVDAVVATEAVTAPPG